MDSVDGTRQTPSIDFKTEEGTISGEAGDFGSPPAFGHDDGVWEDVLDETLAEPHQPPSYPNSHSPGPQSPPPGKNGPQRAVRKRKGGKTIFVAQPSPIRKAFKNKNIQDNVPPLINLDNEKIKGALTAGAGNTYHYVYDVLRHAFWALKTPFAAIVALWILAFLFARLSDTFQTLFSPVCYIPILNRTPFCQTSPDLDKVPKWANFPRLVDVQSNTFEQLLDESVGSSGLSLEIKKAEMATTDLVTLVKVSELKSKDLLAKSLEDFVSDARKSGRGLQKLSSKIGGAVDT